MSRLLSILGTALVYYSGGQRVNRNFASLDEAKSEAEVPGSSR